MGDFKLNLEGPDRHLEEMGSGIDLGGNKYRYTWSLPFNQSSVNNSYNYYLTYLHPALEAGSYKFPTLFDFSVKPLTVTFENAKVTPEEGNWDESYTYSVTLNSSLKGEGILQIFDPCSREWVNVNELKPVFSGVNKLSWRIIKPFSRECLEMSSEPPMYRFRAMLDREYKSDERTGPTMTSINVPRVYSHTLSPSEGFNDTKFNYNITLKFNNQAPIELQIFNPLYNQYESRGKKDYTKPDENQTLTWIESYPQEYQGKELSFKFLYEGYPLVIDTGPRIRQTDMLRADMPNVYSSSVTPRRGILNSTFSYTLTLSHTGPALLELQVAELEGRYQSYGSKPYNNSGRNSTISWQVSNLSNQFSPDFEGTLRYRFLYQGVILESRSGPEILDAGTGTDLVDFRGQKNNDTHRPDPNPVPPNHNNSGITVIGNVSGNVSPAIGVIQEWDERDPLNELTYSLQLNNWISQEMPWVTLVVKPYGSGSSWETAGEKKKYDPSLGNVSWTIKPFWRTPFLGTAEYKFLVDDMESKTFKGPDIVARYNAADNWTSYTHNFLATVNASANLTICLLGGDNSLPENIKKWTRIGDCKKYMAGSGEQNITWQIPQSRPLYYDFDIQTEDKKGSK